MEQARGVYRNLLGNELNWLSIAEFIIISVLTIDLVICFQVRKRLIKNKLNAPD